MSTFQQRPCAPHTVQIPEEIDDLAIRKQLLSEYNLEIGGGLGDLAGKVWRVGLMGESSRARNVLYFLYALQKCLRTEGLQLPSGLEAAAALLSGR